MTAVITQVDLRDVMTLTLESFREFGYRNHRIVYNRLFNAYGSYLFGNVGFCRRLDNELAFQIGVPQGWIDIIYNAWFDENALIRAGYRHLVDRDVNDWWQQ